MNFRSAFHHLAASLAALWLTELHRDNPTVIHVSPSDMYFDGAFPELPEGKVVRVTLEIVDDPKNKSASLHDAYLAHKKLASVIPVNDVLS